MVYVEPTGASSLALIRGTGFWCGTWEALADQLNASGEAKLAEEAASYAARAKAFLQRRVRPWVDKGTHEVEQLQRALAELPDDERSREAGRVLRLEMMERDELEVRRLTELWDVEVDGPDCRRLVDAIEVLAGKTSR